MEQKHVSQQDAADEHCGASPAEIGLTYSISSIEEHIYLTFCELHNPNAVPVKIAGPIPRL